MVLIEEEMPRDGTGEIIRPDDQVLWHYDGTWSLGRVISIRRCNRHTWLLDLVWDTHYYRYGQICEREKRVASGVRSWNVVVVPPEDAP